jgi:hypothetical protein
MPPRDALSPRRPRERWPAGAEGEPSFVCSTGVSGVVAGRTEGLVREGDGADRDGVRADGAVVQLGAVRLVVGLEGRAGGGVEEVLPRGQNVACGVGRLLARFDHLGTGVLRVGVAGRGVVRGIALCWGGRGIASVGGRFTGIDHR